METLSLGRWWYRTSMVRSGNAFVKAATTSRPASTPRCTTPSLPM
jgi:hypothetical protein